MPERRMVRRREPIRVWMETGRDADSDHGSTVTNWLVEGRILTDETFQQEFIDADQFEREMRDRIIYETRDAIRKAFYPWKEYRAGDILDFLADMLSTAQQREAGK